MAQSNPALIEDPNDPGTFLIQDMGFTGPPSGPERPFGGALPPQRTQLVWGAVGERYFETGIDRGVLYLDGLGIAWNGIVSVSDSTSGGEAKSYYIDGMKYANRVGAEEFAAKLDAYTYPDQFEVCDGTREIEYGTSVAQQDRKSFSLSYRTRIGNDIDGLDHGYKIHVIYNVMASPADKAYSSLGETDEPIVFSWGLSTTPILMTGYKPIAHVIIDSRKLSNHSLRAIEDVLYGKGDVPANLPYLEDLLAIIANAIPVKIIPDYPTGISSLIMSETPDLYNGTRFGIFQIAEHSRLVPSDTLGIFKLE